jgi:hypothetical protein
LEAEVRDFERELNTLREQSKKVETDLVKKLQDLSEKFKAAAHERDHLQVKVRDMTAKNLEMAG